MHCTERETVPREQNHRRRDKTRDLNALNTQLTYRVDEIDALRNVWELENLPPLLALALVTIGPT